MENKIYTNEELIRMAKSAMKYSYAPYSKFTVGAALLTKSGKVYQGCNIENASFGAANCAERTAVFKAVSEGEREFEKIAIVSATGQKTFPCGICLQVLSEFFERDAVVLLEDSETILEYRLDELLPNSFKLDV